MENVENDLDKLLDDIMAVTDDVGERITDPDEREFAVDAISALGRPVGGILKALRRLGATGGDGGASAAVFNPARYDVSGELGRGAFGVVYRATDKETGRAVALKVLAGAGTNDELLAREVQVAMGVRSENVVNYEGVFDVRGLNLRLAGTDDAAPAATVIIMELVPGEELDIVIRDMASAPLPARAATVLELANGLADGVVAMHARCVAHRDLKPSNVLVQRIGAYVRPVIVDLGFACTQCDACHDAVACDARHACETNMIAGTPDYTSPEKLAAMYERGGAFTDHAADDMWALGLILWRTNHAQEDVAYWPRGAFKFLHDEVADPADVLGHDFVAVDSATSPGAVPELDEVVEAFLLVPRARRATARQFRDAMRSAVCTTPAKPK